MALAYVDMSTVIEAQVNINVPTNIGTHRDKALFFVQVLKIAFLEIVVLYHCVHSIYTIFILKVQLNSLQIPPGV